MCTYKPIISHGASLKIPLGVHPFWETGVNPSTEWKQWFATLKMAIMARDNKDVDKLLKLKPKAADLLYPTLPTYEDEFEGETKDEARNREQRNEQKRCDLENECKAIERKEHWWIECLDEVDTQAKGFIYLSFIRYVRTPQQIVNLAINICI